MTKLLIIGVLGTIACVVIIWWVLIWADNAPEPWESSSPELGDNRDAFNRMGKDNTR